MRRSRSFFFLLLSVWGATASFAQRTEAIQQYIDQYEALAIAEMQRTGVPASIKLAQGIHETQAGTSDLVQRSNNHFGIKCKTGWSGPSVRHDDDARSECFRKYESATDSYRDHSNFLKTSPRYSALFDLSPTDYQGWARGLKKAGYATNPRYAETLIGLIEEYDLNRFSLWALQHGPSDDPANDSVLTAPPRPLLPVGESSNQPKLSQAVIETAPPASTSRVVAGSPSSGSSVTAYPAGVFRQDGTKAIYVKAGTPYLLVAQQYRLPLSRLFEYNDLAEATETTSDRVLLLERRSRPSWRLPLLNKKSR